MKKILFIITIIVIIILAWVYKNRGPELIDVDLPVAQEYQDFIEEPSIQSTSTEVIVEEVSEEESEGVVKEEEEKTSSINLSVPFISQAPSKNWDQPFQDACEEASILMVDYYYQDKNLPSIEEQELVLTQMVSWQEDNWGGHYNLPATKVADFTSTTFNYRVEIIEDLTADKLRGYLDQGRPVVVPADGHKLANPYFKNDGPDYHMLVVKGYVDDKFITNDPGTQHGADFVYSQENLIYSIHDWDTKKDQAIGPKVGLVLYVD